MFMNLRLPSLAFSLSFLAHAGAPFSTLRLPESGIQPQAIADDAGTIHVVYFKGDPKAGDLYYVQVKGTRFTSAVRVNSQAGSAIAMGTIRGAQVALGKAGRVHVAWNGSSAAMPKGPVNPESGDAGSPMLYSRMDASGVFEPQRNLMKKTFGLDGGGSIAADRDGNVYVVWHGKLPGAAKGEAGRQMWIAASGDSGKTFADEKAAWNGNVGACGCCGTAAFAAKNGDLYLLFRSATEEVHRDIYMLRSSNHGASFEGRLLDRWDINACPMSSMSLVQDGASVIGSWETAGQVFHAPLILGKGPARKQAPVGEGKRKHPRLAVNGKGDRLLVWTDGTGWQKGGSLAWEVLRKDGSKDVGAISDGAAVWSFAAVVAGGDGRFVLIY